MDEPRRFFDRVSMGASERHSRRRALRILGLGAGAAVAAACAPQGGGGHHVTTTSIPPAGCTTAADCAGTATDCATPTCVSGVCGVGYAPFGTQIATGQVVGDCHSLVCNGSGSVVTVVDPTDVPNDGNECTANVCTAGAPSNPPLPVNSVCSAGVCDPFGQCVQCNSGSQCGVDTECRSHTCDAGPAESATSPPAPHARPASVTASASARGLTSTVQVLLLTVRVGVAVTFAVAGVLKLLDREDTGESLRQFGVPRSLVAAATVVLPAVELVVAVLLVPAPTAVLGAVAAAVLLTVFSVAVLRLLRRGESVACRCFGRHSERPVGPRTLVRNGILLALSVWIAASGRPEPVPTVLRDAWASDAVRVTAGLVLVAAVVAEGFIIWQLLVSHGDALRRLRDLEAAPGAAVPVAVPVHIGLPLGEPAPSFEVTDLDGHRIPSTGLLATGVATLVLFTDPACEPCHEIRPGLESWRHELEGHLDLVLVSRGDLEANRADADPALASRTFVQHRDEVADAFRATGTPSAVVVDAEGRIGSGVAAGPPAIHALVQGVIDSMPLRGRRAPSIVLPDLDDRPASPLPGRPHVLVFWSPSCGYCSAVLDEVVAAAPAMDERGRRPVRRLDRLGGGEPSTGSPRHGRAGAAVRDRSALRRRVARPAR